MSSNTDWGCLAQNPKLKKARYWASKTWAVMMIIVLPGWGAFTAGYWLGVDNERDRSAEEVASLHRAYGVRVDKLAETTGRAATAVGQAAASVAASGEAVEQLANQVATQAHQAAAHAPNSQAGKPAAPAPAQTPHWPLYP